MPIYEFYCADCHTVYSFLARRPRAGARPDCPRCGRARLERRASAFAISRGRSEDSADDTSDDGLESALGQLTGEIERVDENDPRQIGELMRRMFDASGMPMGETMQEAIGRMESGEDPDTIEAELGEALEQEESTLDAAAPAAGESSARGRLRQLRRRVVAPRVDRTLYDL